MRSCDDPRMRRQAEAGGGRVRVLVACEFSGVVRDAFASRGHDAWSCDLLPSERNGQHIQADVLSVLNDGWDLMIAHPPCTYLSKAGARWWHIPGRQELANQATEFVFRLRDAPIERIAIENPRGQLNQRWRYPDQIINPFQFGDPYSKATCLWLKNLPPLLDTVRCGKYEPWVACNRSARKRAGLPILGKVSGGKAASRTFPGIAEAMAEQWSPHEP
jgi:hypothetical protein